MSIFKRRIVELPPVRSLRYSTFPDCRMNPVGYLNKRSKATLLRMIGRPAVSCQSIDPSRLVK